MNGVRMPLVLETQFSRYYRGPETTGGCYISRFMDGSASMSASQLYHDWPIWNDEQRSDFCNACVWLNNQSDFADMLRYVMQHGNVDKWKTIAQSVAKYLPQEEAFLLLQDALSRCEVGGCANIVQGLAETMHPTAKDRLRDYLRVIWRHPDLWKEEQGLNWIAFEATVCIASLIKLGVPVDVFNDDIRKLAQHACSQNRDACRTMISGFQHGGARIQTQT
jgi:hypothetical protein